MLADSSGLKGFCLGLVLPFGFLDEGAQGGDELHVVEVADPGVEKLFGAH